MATTKAHDLARLLADGVVGTSEIGDDQVTTAKLPDNAVTTAKIANSAVTADKINIASSDVPYDNTVSGLSANTVKEAIDALNAISGGGNAGAQATFSRQKFTATAGQTSFTITGGYDVGYILVFMNGVLLDQTDFTGSDGSTVSLSTGARAGDEIVVIKLDSFAIAELLRVTQISASAPDDSLTLGSTGALGINVTSPMSMLHVDSTGNDIARLTTTSTSGGYLLFRDGNTSGTEYAWLGKSGDDFKLWRNNSVTALTVDNSGYTGIGNIDPASYYSKELVVKAGAEGGITVAGGTNEEHYLMFADGTSGNAQYKGFIGYNHGIDLLRFGSAGTTRMNIDSAGSVTMPYQPFLMAFSQSGNYGSQSGGRRVWGGSGYVAVNRGNCWNSSTKIFTAPVAGVYLVRVSIRMSSQAYTSGSQYNYIYIHNSNSAQAGTPIRLWSPGNEAYGYRPHELTALMPMNANDTIYPEFYNPAGAVTLDGGTTGQSDGSLSIMLIG